MITHLRTGSCGESRRLHVPFVACARKIYKIYRRGSRVAEDRIESHYGLPSGTVATVANATWGLALALAAQCAKPGTLCAMPAWTFVASAHAAVNAGLVPYFLDVDPDTWAIGIDEVREAIRRAPAPVGAVMPVFPFGRPISLAGWDAFRAETGLAVVIDAAAGFESLVPGVAPAVVSLHATKVLGTGEGGFVVSTERAIVDDVHRRSVFGFRGSREAAVGATNAKMSEYHAAVGLASLDEWRDTRADWMTVGETYRSAIGQANVVCLQTGYGSAWVASTCTLHIAGSAAAPIERALAAKGMETRRWWGGGAHAHPATAGFPRTPLPVTERLANSTIGVPCYRDLAPATIDRIVDIVRAAIAT